MGNCFRQLAVKPRLKSRQRELLMRHWPAIKEHQPNLFLSVWMSVADQSADIRKIFSISLKEENPERSLAFVRLSEVVESFFDKLIVEQRLEEESVQRECYLMGVRHTRYAPNTIKGFNMSDWELFAASLIVAVDALKLGVSGAERVRLMEAWRLFVCTAVEYMTRGYQDNKPKRNSRRPTVQIE